VHQGVVLEAGGMADQPQMDQRHQLREKAKLGDTALDERCPGWDRGADGSRF
jgi:hypothetical protein